ncbi:flavin reductase family protein [Candidatus Latescibacterota bacterium]
MKEVSIGDGEKLWGPPERVVLVTSVDGEGKANIISVGWAMRANMAPPVFAIGLGKKSHSCASISASGEFVFCLPGTSLAQQVMYCGTHSGREVDKFAETGLTALPASRVKAPLIGECLASFECRVVASQDIGDHRVFFGEVLATWQGERREPHLLVVGEGAGYETVHEEGSFRLGAVRA